MCGFIGKFSKNENIIEEIIEANKYNICRGPDDLKSYNGLSKDIFYSLIFNRLSIIDLSDKASQPMEDDYKNILMFNGEIYNHKALRVLLEDKQVKFKTSHSDTEVVLHGLRIFGKEFLNMLIGQFSIFYFNPVKNHVILARDRVGQKPLFYFKDDVEFIFSSNLKALLKLKKNYEINQDSLIEYLDSGVVASPNTLFKDIYKLYPGQAIEIDLNKKYKFIDTSFFWSTDEIVNSTKKPFVYEEFRELLVDSILLRQNADVSVANLLSGGIDSTTILKLASENSQNLKVNTFSVTNKGSVYDEEEWINFASKKYNSNQTKINIDIDNIDFEQVEESIKIFDEPYADPSTVPSYLLYKEISKSFKVAISGDGGDELLGGYERIVNTLNRGKYFNYMFRFYPGIFGSGNKLSVNQNNLKNAYMTYFKDPKFLKLLNLNNDRKINFRDLEISEYLSMINFDLNYYLPEMMMLKVDRTSMANSVEVRSPFVDHRLIEYILKSDYSVESKKDQKEPLKKILSKDFDIDFLNRKKMGFVFNLENWIYNNSQYIEHYFKNDSNLINDMNKNIFKILSLYKTRINGQRIWRLYFLEKYLDSLKSI